MRFPGWHPGTHSPAATTRLHERGDQLLSVLLLVFVFVELLAAVRLTLRERAGPPARGAHLHLGHPGQRSTGLERGGRG